MQLKGYSSCTARLLPSGWCFIFNDDVSLASTWIITHAVIKLPHMEKKVVSLSFPHSTCQVIPVTCIDRDCATMLVMFMF